VRRPAATGPPPGRALMPGPGGVAPPCRAPRDRRGPRAVRNPRAMGAPGPRTRAAL